MNIVGSLFYGGMLGVFVLAFFFKRSWRRTARLSASWQGKPLIFSAFFFTKISFLWYNVIGCVVVVAVGVLISRVFT